VAEKIRWQIHATIKLVAETHQITQLSTRIQGD